MHESTPVPRESRYVGTEHVPLRRLDSMAMNTCGLIRNDAEDRYQGYEDRVLRELPE
jgi:hypothetical protein